MTIEQFSAALPEVRFLKRKSVITVICRNKTSTLPPILSEKWSYPGTSRKGVLFQQITVVVFLKAAIGSQNLVFASLSYSRT